MNKLIIGMFAGMSISMAGISQAAELDIEVTNLTHGLYFTPLLIGAHNSATTLYEPGAAASSHLQIMAECGDISGLSGDLDTAGANKVENPAGGLLAPAASTMTSLSTTSGNDHLSVVAMMLPTNDGFVAAGSVSIPTTAGTYTYYLNGYDAGTEANNELIDDSGCVAGMAGIPAAPGGDAGSNGTGVTTSESNGHIHIHRGTLGDTNASGGNSDLDSTIHRWQNPVAKLVVTVN